MTLQQISEVAAYLSANGWAIVPMSPTPEMLEAGWADAHDEDAAGTWKEMVSEAPSVIDWAAARS